MIDATKNSPQGLKADLILGYLRQD